MKWRSIMPMLLAPLVAIALSSATGAELSPVTRVVELLRGLAEKIDDEMKTEKGLFKKFECWSKTIVAEKTAANEKAQARIDELQTYVDDLEAGRIELTSERVDLEKDIERLTTELETAENMRKKENADYLAAKGELTTGITALKDAIKVLKDARSGSPAAPTFLMVAGEERVVHRDGDERVFTAEGLSRVLQLASGSLSNGDKFFLEHLLSGWTVPEDTKTWNWKKLDKKADFKMKYETRTAKIEDVLSALLFQFESGLKETEHKEKEAVKFYNALKKDKGDLKDKATTALGKMELEGAARGLSLKDAKAEIQALKDDITADTKYIAQAKKELEDKEKEWDARKELQNGEIEAINKAISILYNDDARDLFKESFKSQGYSLIETSRKLAVVSQVSGTAIRQQAAEKALRATGSKRIVQLAERIAHESTGHFDAVLAAIDKMIKKLQAEEGTELEAKEKCEEDRMTDTREAITLSRAMDELTEEIVRLEAKIKELEEEKEAAEEEVKQLEKDKEDAKKVRDDENAAWVISDKDDADAADIVGKAVDVLKAYYQAKFGFVQKSRQPISTAGEAPPPPPATWEKPYGGQTESKEGIVAILEMVKEDILKDQASAKKAEDDAKAKYDQFVTDTDAKIAKTNKEITRLGTEIGRLEGDVTTAKSDREGKGGELEAAMKKIKDAAEECNYITETYALRTQNRQIELDGLLKAQGILKGAKFDEGPDPNREKVPGDAFVQKHGH